MFCWLYYIVHTPYRARLAYLIEWIINYIYYVLRVARSVIFIWLRFNLDSMLHMQNGNFWNIYFQICNS